MEPSEPAVIEQIIALCKELIDHFQEELKLPPDFVCCHNLRCISSEMSNSYVNKDFPLPESVYALQEELKSFKDYLVNEQKKKVVSPSIIPPNEKEVVAKFEIIKQKMNSLVLDMKDYRVEVRNYGVPRAMWIKYFKKEEQVLLQEFCRVLKDYTLEKFKLDLTDDQLDAVYDALNGYGNQMISYGEWKHFWLYTWQAESNINKLINSPHQSEQKAKDVVPITLKVIQANKEDIPNSIYPKDHEFFISFDKIEYNDFDGKLVSFQKNWRKQSLVVGKLKDQQKPDIYYNNKVNSCSDKQFQINLRKMEMESNYGFYLTNLSVGFSPTCLKIDEIPYIVETGMIFQVGNVLIQVDEVEPIPNGSIGDMVGDCRFLNFLANKFDPEDTTCKTVKASPFFPSAKQPIQHIQQPKLILKCLQGGATNAPKKFISKKNKDLDVIVGSSEDCEFMVE